MRRQDLIRLINIEAKSQGVTFSFKRRGGNHDIFTLGNSTIAIGRHRVLKPGDVNAILDETEKELGEKWWR